MDRQMEGVIDCRTDGPHSGLINVLMIIGD